MVSRFVGFRWWLDMVDEADDNNLIIRGRDGDPVATLGTLMTERESYERVVEGLRLAADAAAHLALREHRYGNLNARGLWSGLSRRLDQVRKMAVQHAGIGLVIKQKETGEVRGEGLRFAMARKRFREGIKQAAGGMRQLAVCHRGEVTWSRMANDLETMERKTRVRERQVETQLIMPAGHA